MCLLILVSQGCYSIILMLLMIAPCIINCLNHFVSAQVTKLQHAMPVQLGYIKLQQTTENITHPQMDTAIRTRRPETSKKGGPMPTPSQFSRSHQRELNAPIPKELASHLLRGECQVVRIVNRSPKWLWLKDKEGKSPGKQKKGRSREGPRTGVGTSGRQTAFLASLICIGQAQWESKT